jgi:hypothetical protein
MSHISVNHLPRGTRLTHVVDLLKSLGYQRETSNTFRFPDDDFSYNTGVSVRIERSASRTGIEVYTTNRRDPQKADTDLHNETIRQLRRRFGGSFWTTAGANRYKHYSEPSRGGAECACYIAVGNLVGNLVRARTYLEPLFKRLEDPEERTMLRFHGDNHHIVVATNLLLAFLVSVVEEYFKATYIALFRVSANKANVVHRINLRTEDLDRVLIGELPIEQAIVRRLSFQDFEKLGLAFAALDKRIDIVAALKRPFRRRKESLLESLNALVNRRNALIHANRMDVNYRPLDAERDLHNINVALRRVYLSIVNVYRWDDRAGAIYDSKMRRQYSVEGTQRPVVRMRRRKVTKRSRVS